MPTSTPVEVESFESEVLLKVLSDVKGGDFTARMPVHWTGIAGKIADQLNDIIGANEGLGTELKRVSRVVGKEGKLSQRVSFKGTDQVWGDCIESVNSLIEDLVQPSNEMQRVIGAVADGDLSKKVSVDVQGEMLVLKNTINDMVDQLNGFVSEVTRVAREVGTEGKLGQAAAVTIEVGGVWKDLTDNVNLMADNLTGQVRDIAEVTTAVANGDLSKKITADVKGEFLELKNTVNAMVDQLNRFASEVTRVAREVGFEGKLGGQAQSAEVAGVWKDLTDNVNQLAANLTNQVRAIADVATAVTEGDLTRQVGVEASGEVAVLKDKLNEMIRNLRETTRQNTEQDWLKTNLERFTRMLQGQRDLATVSSMVLSELAPLVSAQHGAFYALTDVDDGEPVLQFQAGYGFKERKHLSSFFRLGEGLVGQCAIEKERILLTEVPSDYIQINSGLGASAPLNIIVLPILFEGSVRAVIELASFAAFSPAHQSLLDQLTESIGLVLNTVDANAVTERLLEQSQSQAQELQSRQEQLHQSNEDLAKQATLLADKNSEVEGKYQEVEEAKRLVEQKATELSVSSRYKSEFIANMSHELRTPLNSLLVLAEQLEDNPDGNLTEHQVRYASVIRSSGGDLLKLLNDILDLAKVESDTVRLELREVALAELRESVEAFEHVAVKEGLEFSVEVDSELPETMRTDSDRLGQVLKNLLVQRLQVHGGRRDRRAPRSCHRGLGSGSRATRSGRIRDRDQRRRHGHRDQAGAASGDVRGLRPGGRHYRAPVRRHRTWPLDQPQPSRPPRRRDHPEERAGRGQHVHRLPASWSRSIRRPRRSLRQLRSRRPDASWSLQRSPPRRRRSMTRSPKRQPSAPMGRPKPTGLSRPPCSTTNKRLQPACRPRPRRRGHPPVTASTRVPLRESRCWWSTTTSATSSR